MYRCKAVTCKKNLKKSYLYIGIILVSWMAIFTFINGDVQSLWVDELSSIGYIRSGISFTDMLYTYLFCDTNLPLYSIILYFYYRIMPYGEQYLLIPSIIFCVGGVWIFSHCVKNMLGERAGVIALCLCCASNALIWQGAWEVRCYSLTFFMAAVAFGCFVKKMQTPSRISLIVYSIVVALFISTHWFASLVLAFYGLVDLLLIISKKMSWKNLFVYVPALLFFLPWTAVAFLSKQEEISNFWGIIPEWKNLLWTILFWLSGRRWLWYMCLIAGFVCCAKWMLSIFVKDKCKDFKSMVGAWCTATIVWVIGIVYVYSRIINPEGSLYIERYFVVIVPPIMFLTVLGLDDFLDRVDKIVESRYIKNRIINKSFGIGARIIVGIILISSWVLCYREEYIAIRKPFEKFREAAEYLISDGRIWKEDTLFVASNRYCVLDGFVEYYFEKKGYNEPENIVDGGVHSIAESRFYPNYKQYSEEELLEYNHIICLRIHMHYDEEFADFLGENYIQIQGAEENGIEIWSKKLFIGS